MGGRAVLSLAFTQGARVTTCARLDVYDNGHRWLVVGYGEHIGTMAPCLFGLPSNQPGEPQLAHPYYPAERCADAVRYWPAGSRAPHVHECRGALRRTRRCKAR